MPENNSEVKKKKNTKFVGQKCAAPFRKKKKKLDKNMST